MAAIKNPLLLIVLMFSLNVTAQYGADGAVAAGAHAALWAVEKNDLDAIIEGQDLILIANVALALEEAKLVDISKKRYKSLSNIDEDVENALTLAQIVEHGESIYSVQDEIFEMIAPYPEVEAIITPSLVDLILEQAFLLNDIGKATLTGQNNLMDSSERFVYMRNILAELDQINDLAIKVKSQARSLITLTETELNQYAPLPLYNYQVPIERIRQRIEDFISE